MEVAFIARLTMASETGGDGATGGSGVYLQTALVQFLIHLVDQKPLQVQKRTVIFVVGKSASIIINVLLIQTLTVSSHFSEGYS